MAQRGMRRDGEPAEAVGGMLRSRQRRPHERTLTGAEMDHQMQPSMWAQKNCSSTMLTRLRNFAFIPNMSEALSTSCPTFINRSIRTSFINRSARRSFIIRRLEESPPNSAPSWSKGTVESKSMRNHDLRYVEAIDPRSVTSAWLSGSS